jgi:hypothetical protein
MDGDASRQALLARLEQKHALAALDKWEREAFLATHLGWRADDPPASQKVWQAAIFDLPEEMDEGQLEAWLELAEIASDESFREILERQRQPLAGVDQTRLLEWQQRSQQILSVIVQIMSGERDLDGCQQQALLDEWIQGFAKLHSRSADDEFLRWMLHCFESTDDSRMERYWELVSRIKALPPQPPVYGQAMKWLLQKFSERVSSL